MFDIKYGVGCFPTSNGLD